MQTPESTYVITVDRDDLAGRVERMSRINGITGIKVTVSGSTTLLEISGNLEPWEFSVIFRTHGFSRFGKPPVFPGEIPMPGNGGS